MGTLVFSALFVTPSQARAKTGIFEDDKNDWDEDDFFSSKEKQVEASPQQQTRSGDHDHSHHEPPPVLSAGPLGSPQNWNTGSGGGSQMGNFAGHNESCTPTGKSCVLENKQECSATDGTGRCICIANYIYVRRTETCWPIIKAEEETCAHDIQCQAGKWGQHSRCSERTAKCECFDHTTGGKREMVLVEGGCFIKKTLGDLCNTHEECDKTIRGDAYCKLGDHHSSGGQNYNGSCQCRDTHMWWRPLNACLRLATKLKDDCKITEQCKKGSLGGLSECTQDAKCECLESHNDKDVVYYGTLAKCFERREYNETCTNEDECKASLGPDVKCDVTEEYPDERVCHCPKGITCRNSGIIHASSAYSMALCVGVAVIGRSLLMT